MTAAKNFNCQTYNSLPNVVKFSNNLREFKSGLCIYLISQVLNEYIIIYQLKCEQTSYLTLKIACDWSVNS